MKTKRASPATQSRSSRACAFGTPEDDEKRHPRYRLPFSRQFRMINAMGLKHHTLRGLIGLIVVACPVAPGSEPDIEEISLSLCALQEPGVDRETLRSELDALEAAARSKLGNTDSPESKLRSLSEALLSDREVTYMSRKYWRDSTLAAPLLRRKGNCLSTTTLFIVMARRLRVPLKAVLVPRHAFARYDDGTTRINLETTRDGKHVPDRSFQSRSPWPEVDVPVLGYGLSLSDSQFAAALSAVAASHLLQTRRPQEALKLVDKALELWPQNDGYRSQRLGIMYSGLERPKEAIAGYKRLYQSSRSLEVKARALLGLTADHQAHSRHVQALAVLKCAYAIAPKHMQGSVLSFMASSYRTLRRFDDALLAQELSTVLSGDASDYSGLAIFYKNAGRLEDAIRCLKLSLAKNPESWSTRLILAGYLIRAGHGDEGWAMFGTVEKPLTDHAFYHTNLAWFYASVGKKAEFLQHLDQGLTLSKTHRILNYIRTEVDFDRYRQDADFQKTVGRHRARLLGH